MLDSCGGAGGFEGVEALFEADDTRFEAVETRIRLEAGDLLEEALPAAGRGADEGGAVLASPVVVLDDAPVSVTVEAEAGGEPGGVQVGGGFIDARVHADFEADGGGVAGAAGAIAGVPALLAPVEGLPDFAVVDGGVPGVGRLIRHPARVGAGVGGGAGVAGLVDGDEGGESAGEGAVGAIVGSGDEELADRRWCEHSAKVANGAGKTEGRVAPSSRPLAGEGNRGGAEEASVLAEGAGVDRGVDGGAVGKGCHGLAQGVEEQIAHPEQAAGEGDGVGVENVDDAAQTDADGVAAVAYLGDGGLLAKARGFGEIAGGRRTARDQLRKEGRGAGLDEAAGAASESDAAGDGFEAAARAAAAGGTGGVQHDVADFAGQSLGAAVEAAIDDDAAANARAEGGVQEMARSFPDPETMLAKGGGGGVVLDGDGNAQTFGEGGGKGEVAEGGDVRRDHDPPAFGVDEAGHGEGGAHGRLGALIAHAREEGGDALEGRLGGGFRRAAHFLTREDLARFADEGGAQVRPAEVAGDHGSGHGGTVRERGLSLDRRDARRHPARMEAWQERLLEDARAGALGTIARSGLPQLTPVCYALTGGAIAIAIDEKPKGGGALARIRNIRRDPRATLLVHHYEERWERLAWLRLDCEAGVLERGEAWPDALAALRRRYPRYRGMALEGRPLIRLRPARVTGWRWQDGQAQSQRVPEGEGECVSD